MPKRSKENSNYTTASSSSSKKKLGNRNCRPQSKATRGDWDFIDRFGRTCTPLWSTYSQRNVSIRIYQTARRVIRWIQYMSPEVPAHLVFSANSFFAAYVLCRLASPICPKWWWRQCRWLCKSKPPTYRGKNADRIDSHRFVLVFLAFDGFLHAVLTGQWTVVLGS